MVPDGTFIAREVEVNQKKSPRIYQEARKLRPGEYSGVIQAADALHIIRLKEYVAEKQFSLDEVKPLLMNKLQGEAQRQAIRDYEALLKKSAQIDVIDKSEWQDKL
jgi:parvulin-like peptidyl-prolyl isomerase